MDVRRATVTDVDAIRRVAAASWHAAHDHILGPETVDSLLERWYGPDDLEASIGREHHPMFVGTDSANIIGFAQGGPSDEPYADAVVSRIYVHPQQWGAGCGTLLLERLLTALREAGHDDVWLSVLTENSVGRGFYEGHGFEVEEEREIDLAGESVADCVLIKEL